ncbi:MAG TPA: peptidylprolyl isomerase [Blastocatellia bacterium]|nr:peptidylprolyl isomerase [Blastocatellia bacterium]
MRRRSTAILLAAVCLLLSCGGRPDANKQVGAATKKATASTPQQQAALDRANALLQRIREGEDFATLARRYSEDPGSKNSGGEYIFARGKMAPEFEAAAFSLEPGEVSDVIATTFGYHIIKTEEYINRGTPQEQVRARHILIKVQPAP